MKLVTFTDNRHTYRIWIMDTASANLKIYKQKKILVNAQAKTYQKCAYIYSGRCLCILEKQKSVNHR